MKRRSGVTITKVRRHTMTVPTTVLLARCPVCEREVETLSTAVAVAMLAIAGRMLDAGVASGRVLVVKMLGGSPRVCKESLFVG